MLFKSLYQKQGRIKDCLLSITNRCSECNIQNFCENQEDFSVLLGNLTSGALELIQDSFVVTPFTKKIVSTPWHSSASLITFRKSTSVITEVETEKKVEEILKGDGVKKGEITKSQVDVRMLPLGWLLSDHNTFVNFVGILGGASNNQIYDTELIGTLLGEFWNENYKKILYRALIPWVCYAISVLYYFSYALSPDNETRSSE